MPLTHEQKYVIQTILNWLAERDRPAMTLGGYAGTGKTTVLAALRKVLAVKRPKWKIAFTAYTGKATQVLASKLKPAKLLMPQDSLGTLHSLLYSPRADKAGNVSGWVRKNELDFDLVIIDEASMLNEEMWLDILRFGIPVLAVGDHGQLPPIGDPWSLMKEPDLALTQIHRQAEESPIIHVATLARTTGEIPIEKFGPGVQKVDLQRSDSSLILEELYQQYNPDTLFLVGQNRTRQAINNSIRAALFRTDEKPEAGDVVICLRNNWQKNIYNGMTGLLQSVKPIKNAEGELISYDAVVTDFSGTVLYDGRIAAAQFNAPTTINLTKQERKVQGELFDFGYALTVHKAQGSQARKVVVIEQRSQHMSDEDWRRWLYTAVTRAEEELWVFGSDPYKSSDGE